MIPSSTVHSPQCYAHSQDVSFFLRQRSRTRERDVVAAQGPAIKCMSYIDATCSPASVAKASGVMKPELGFALITAYMYEYIVIRKFTLKNKRMW